MNGEHQYSQQEIEKLFANNAGSVFALDVSRMKELGRNCYPNLFQKESLFQQVEDSVLIHPEFRSGYLASAWEDSSLSGKEGIIRYLWWNLRKTTIRDSQTSNDSVQCNYGCSLFRFWQSTVREYEMPGGFDVDLLELATPLAKFAPNAFIALLHKLKSWTSKTDFLVRPLIQTISDDQQREALSQKVVTGIVVANDQIEGSKLEKDLAILALIFGIVAWMQCKACNRSSVDYAFGLSLIRSILANIPRRTTIRVTMLACLLSMFRGEVTEVEIHQVSDNQSMKMWVFNSLLTDQQKELLSLADICHIFECPSIGRDLGFLTAFVECGIIQDNILDYSMVFLISRQLELTLDEDTWNRLCICCFAYPSGASYWQLPGRQFSVLMEQLAATMSEQIDPISFVKKLRDGIDAMMFRMRTTRDAEQFVCSCHAADLYLMTLVFMLADCFHQSHFNEALSLFELGWKDCVIGLFVGEHGRWPRVFMVVQFLFYYKVAKLDPHFGQWNNTDLLNSLPIRSRDTDPLTCHELCIDCLLKNESTVPWDDIAVFDPKLNDEIQQYRNKVHTRRRG